MRRGPAVVSTAKSDLATAVVLRKRAEVRGGFTEDMLSRITIYTQGKNNPYCDDNMCHIAADAVQLGSEKPSIAAPSPMGDPATIDISCKYGKHSCASTVDKNSSVKINVPTLPPFLQDDRKYTMIVEGKRVKFTTENGETFVLTEGDVREITQTTQYNVSVITENTSPATILGDMNGDGKLDLKDIIISLQTVAGFPANQKSMQKRFNQAQQSRTNLPAGFNRKR
jgi:hypothetical protein